MSTSPLENPAISAASGPASLPYLMEDTAYPVKLRPTGFDAVAGYIGGSALHEWQNADFWSLPHHVRRLPIFVGAVKGQARSNPRADAALILQRVQALTMARTRVIALDMETS